MPTLETPLAEELAETAHWSDDPPINIDDQEFDLLAFELWHLGNYPDLTEAEEGAEEDCTVAGRASCL
jgi:hypothetical protein